MLLFDCKSFVTNDRPIDEHGVTIIGLYLEPSGMETIADMILIKSVKCKRIYLTIEHPIAVRAPHFSLTLPLLCIRKNMLLLSIVQVLRSHKINGILVLKRKVVNLLYISQYPFQYGATEIARQYTKTILSCPPYFLFLRK